MKVLIVGAGAAGITAAHLLSEAGVDFEVLEAADRYGGRVKAVDDFVDIPLDVGAEWIHRWIKARPQIAQALLSGADPNFKTLRDDRPGLAFGIGGRVVSTKMLSWVPIPDDHKFYDKSWFDFVDQLVTAKVADRLRLKTPVIKIRHNESGVEVTTQDGEVLTADKVLVTVPIKMLQRRSIEFTPPLPAMKLEEIDKEEMPEGIKVFIEFEERFYPDLLTMVQVFGADRQGDAIYYDATYGRPTKRHVLGLFSQGAKAKKYVNHPEDQATVDFVIAELDGLFSGEASRHYRQHLVQNWSREPHVAGSYSARKASAPLLFEPVADRLYFAGEAMNPSGQTIAVHGAMESAYAALERMGLI